MDINLIIKEILLDVKKELSKYNDFDDEIVYDTILDTIFNNTLAKKLNSYEIKEIADTCFYKIRKRLSILQPLIEDKSITEIMVNGPKEIFVEKNGVLIKNKVSFDDIKELETVMQNIAGDVHREINELNPIVDCRLLDGSRVNGVYKNVAINGPILTIRKFSESFLELDDLVKNGTLTNECKDFLSYIVSSGYNIFISGGTSSGKTTLLNALTYKIPINERVIVIEDSMELKINSLENVVHLEAKKGNHDGIGKVSMSDLIKTSLRMRPDRIIVGEVRGDEVVPMLQAMNTGHDGSLSTGHANSIMGMLKRLETLYLSALPIALDAIRLQIIEGIDFMIHIERLENGKRTITEISEIVDYKNGEYLINKIFDYSNNKLKKVDNYIFNTRKIKLKGELFENELRNSGFIK